MHFRNIVGSYKFSLSCGCFIYPWILSRILTWPIYIQTSSAQRPCLGVPHLGHPWVAHVSFWPSSVNALAVPHPIGRCVLSNVSNHHQNWAHNTWRQTFHDASPYWVRKVQKTIHCTTVFEWPKFTSYKISISDPVDSLNPAPLDRI